MKKKLISLAIAGALATPLAVSADSTNVTLFGSAQAEYNTVDIDGISNQSNVGDDAGRSRWGLNVTEQLGGGLRATAHIEYGLNMGSGNLGFARERWVGLGNDAWGDVKFGRVASPFKDFAGGMTIDPFAYTTLQAGGSGGTMVASSNGMGAGANGFVNSAARYDSPVVEGFAFSALLMPGDSKRLDPVNGGVLVAPVDTASGGTNSGGEDGEWDFQIAAKHSSQFGAHGVDVFGGYSRDNVSTRERNFVAGLGGNSDDEEVWRGGASWTYEAFRLSGQYENINNASITGAASCTTTGALGTIGNNHTGQCNTAMNIGGDGEVWFAGAEYKIGNTRLIAQGGKSHARKGGVNLAGGAGQGKDAWSYTAGVIHELSKRSSLFGGYQRVDLQDNAATADRDRNTYTVGMRHHF